MRINYYGSNVGINKAFRLFKIPTSLIDGKSKYCFSRHYRQPIQRYMYKSPLY